MLSDLLIATLFLTALGLGAAVVLAIAARAFHVWEDPKVLSIVDALPGANCGGCGFAGCQAAAEAVAAGKAKPDLCVVGGFDTARAVAELMGMTVEEKEPDMARTSCSYGTDEAAPLFAYNGAHDCRAAMVLYGGSKLCPIGCIGMGSCVKVCRFGAVVIGDHQLPVFNADRCVGCGACVEACPKNIIALSSSISRMTDEYRTSECTAPCQRGCPTGIDIPRYLRHARLGEYAQGLAVIKEKCPLPLICGRICPAPCEFECRRELVDQSVSINGVKRFLADHEKTNGKHVKITKAPDSGHKIAVVGGGAEGLTLAYYLARLGHEPTIYEAKPQLGGILRYVISEDRLPHDVLDYEIQDILDAGVEAKTEQTMGQDFDLKELLAEGFDVVALTSGGYDSRKLLQNQRGGAPGLMLLIDFLADVSTGKQVRVGEHVVLVQGSPVALRAARHCLRMGAKRVTFVSHRAGDKLHESLRDTEKLKREGIEVRPSTVVAAFGGEGKKLTRLILESLDENGSMTGQRERVEAQTLIVAVGWMPELVIEPVAESNAWQTIETYRTFPHGGSNGIFTPAISGRVSDSEAVVKSILSGRRLSRAIHQQITEGHVRPMRDAVCEAKSVLNLDFLPEPVRVSPRETFSLDSAEAGTENIWVNQAAAIATGKSATRREEVPGLSEDEARHEAKRCLECGLICYRDVGEA